MNCWLKRMRIVMALAAVAYSPSLAAAACGDLNNDGDVTVADAVLLSQCVGGSCPANVCGNGNVLSCGDLLKDFTLSNADLAVLVDSEAGLETLFDLCQGCGPTIGYCSGDGDTACASDADCSVAGGTCNLASCPGDGNLTFPSRTIASSQRWPASCEVRLNGSVFAQTPSEGPTTVLCIDAGTTVKGVVGSSDPATLIFLTTDVDGNGIPDRKAKINAQGTPASPIVFTSSAPPGSRSKGDWAGLMLNGLSTVNRPLCAASAEGLPTAFGGCNPADSSGIARYLRVEYAGLDFTPNNELNLFTMNAIGNRTVIDHVHANVGDDDCIEWFGGTVNSKYMVASGCGDDGFDWQLGFTGALQFGLMLQHGQLTDPNRDSRGIEGDNSEFGNNDLPRSNPALCNVTLVGGRENDNGGSDAGILLRRGTAGSIANAIVTGFQDAGVEFRDVATTQMACEPGPALNGSDPNLRVSNSIFFANGDYPGAGTEHCKSGTISGGNCSTCEWYGLLVATENVENANGSNTTDPGQSTTYPASGQLYTARPSGTLIAPASCSDIDEWFENPSYVGAFDPAGPANGWLTQPWNSFDPS